MSRNPFDDHSDGDPFDDDPFGDSSISSALRKGGNSGQQLTDDTRDAIPLHSVRRSEDAGGFLSSVGFGGGKSGSYKPLGADSDAHAGYTNGGSYGAGKYDIDNSSAPKAGSYIADSREAELRRREEALEARERDLRAREVNMSNMASGARPPLNFPPLYPIMYHAIDTEVPIGDRRTVRTIFYLWLALEAILVFNCIACLIVMIFNASDVSNAGASFGSSFVYLFTITLGSFFLWYRPVYNAYMKDSSMFFYLFFIFNGFHILFDAYMAVGVPSAGSAGIIIMIQCISSSKKAGAVLSGITFSLWVLHFLASLFMYIKVRRHYKARGHTFAEAKQQAYVGFAQSGAGQAAVSTAAGAYVRSNTGNFV
ncbi:hypothetical protein GGI25_006020 [Coemansia spiralis]|uniref:Scamp-domain-containing protein n=2 Tax=Coemansia TaxID=4863 RepID=A0A9W8FXM9_9FUNG|nr:scamp family-domain-containing protein [Coemansia spiralis]KAJ1987120.1 hypothetical protein EDC05_005992 [Coemansia umbellata]KAJ2619054.1 hypothetical protein GGI26_006140 [Coemansia sp. RSA 1358]KAJ2669843.1 hypothetical protein GGI25_006020 [Coemansia spiralis]